MRREFPAVSLLRGEEMSEGYEYNLLTQELLLQGYTAEHYPDYVRIGNGRLGKSSLKFMRRFYIYQRLSGKESIYVWLWSIRELGKMY